MLTFKSKVLPKYDQIRCKLCDNYEMRWVYSRGPFSSAGLGHMVQHLLRFHRVTADQNINKKLDKLEDALSELIDFGPHGAKGIY